MNPHRLPTWFARKLILGAVLLVLVQILQWGGCITL